MSRSRPVVFTSCRFLASLARRDDFFTGSVAGTTSLPFPFDVPTSRLHQSHPIPYQSTVPLVVVIFSSHLHHLPDDAQIFWPGLVLALTPYLLSVVDIASYLPHQSHPTPPCSTFSCEWWVPVCALALAPGHHSLRRHHHHLFRQ